MGTLFRRAFAASGLARRAVDSASPCLGSQASVLWWLWPLRLFQRVLPSSPHSSPPALGSYVLVGLCGPFGSVRHPLSGCTTFSSLVFRAVMLPLLAFSPLLLGFPGCLFSACVLALVAFGLGGARFRR